MKIKSLLFILCISFVLTSCSQTELLTFPAHSLSYNQNDPGITLHTRGVNWANSGGNLSLTIRRPKSYQSGAVKLAFFYQVVNDSAGTIILTVTPVGFNSGASFETYGSVGSSPINTAETINRLYEQSVLIEPGNGFNSDAQWWYFEIARQGTYNGEIRLMSVEVGVE